MPTTITFPDNYGYVAMVALGAIPILGFIQGSVVTRLRKAAKVQYPNAYATAEQAKSSPDAHKFNCAQRAHANLLENMPQAIGTILFSGLFYPVATAAVGAGWVVSRGMFAYGYIYGKGPNGSGRMLGAGQYFATLGLLGMAMAGARKLI